ncbi:multicopper oxidase domain-containing protein [Phthorimaea operculella]|nr:multicopper oxidase domain-containing protein [Phthorimaea operculella]
MIVTDWIHDLSLGMFTHHHHSWGDNKPPTLLINGVGRFAVFDNATHTNKPVYMKSAVFNVEQEYEFIIIVTDWIHSLSLGMFTHHHHSWGDNKPPTLLINGVGRFAVFDNATHTNKPVYMKSAVFNVEQREIDIRECDTRESYLRECENVTPGNVSPGNVSPGNVTPENVTPGNDTPGNVIVGNAPPDNVTPAFPVYVTPRCDSSLVDPLSISGDVHTPPPLVGRQQTTDVAYKRRGEGYRYRFRVINAEFLNCPIELSVDGHNITVIASDGFDLEPITATSLVTYAGERFDFIIDADNEIDNYWIRFRGLMDCDERFTKAKQVAVLRYEGAMEAEPVGDPTWEELHNEGLQLNALNRGEEDDETISVAEMKSIAGYDESLKPHADYQFYISYDFYPKNNSHFHRSPYYGYYQVPEKANRLYTPQLNHISMKMPSSPLLITRPSADNFCNSSSIEKSCKEEYCECSHVLSVKLNSVVEIVLVDEGVTFDANHPFHLHGHNFRVVGMRRLASNTTIEQVKAFDEAGLLKRNLKNAPLKDTITVPDGGYTVIRFKADNPGYWLFHCHIEFHVEVGMALVFKVGEHKDMRPVPRNFPTCGSYLPDNNLEYDTTNAVWVTVVTEAKKVKAEYKNISTARDHFKVSPFL